MIQKIIKSELSYTHMQHVYNVHDEEGEFGFIALHRDHEEVIFKLTEEKWLELDEMALIYEFMDRIQKIIENKELDTLRNEYFYATDPRKAQSTDSPSKQ
jgi:hypothetical protein